MEKYGRLWDFGVGNPLNSVNGVEWEYPSEKMEDSGVESSVDYRSPAQKVSEVHNISNSARGHSCDILIM